MKRVDFGFKKVESSKKQPLVNKVFSDVASKYDMMNDIMSFGLHRSWKKVFISEITSGKGAKILDVAGGTGDIAYAIKKKYPSAEVVFTDINEEMLNATDYNDVNIEKRVADVQSLPFKDNTFDYVMISFGLRNIPDKDRALKEILRVLKPGGKFCCLEFSNVENKLIQKVYDFYSFNIIPKMGKYVANSSEAYQYLVESIRVFPPAESLKRIMAKVGFSMVRYYKLNFGVVAIHTGYKL